MKWNTEWSYNCSHGTEWSDNWRFGHLGLLSGWSSYLHSPLFCRPHICSATEQRRLSTSTATAHWPVCCGMWETGSSAMKCSTCCWRTWVTRTSWGVMLCSSNGMSGPAHQQGPAASLHSHHEGEWKFNFATYHFFAINKHVLDKIVTTVILFIFHSEMLGWLLG